MSVNSFGAKSTLQVNGTAYEISKLDAVEGHDTLPFSLKVLLENLLRTEDGANITAEQISAPWRVGRECRPEQGDPVHSCTRPDAGLHWRALCGRSGHDARSHR